MQPTEQEIKEYYDAFLPKLTNENARHFHIKKALNEKLYVRDKLVLDLGCGTGISTKFLSQRGARKVVGVDISMKLIQYAMQHNYAENIDYVCCDVPRFFLGERADVIVMCDMLEHIPLDRISEVKEMLRSHIHENTVIYLNIPYSNLQRFLKERAPGFLQIVDERYPIELILDMFRKIDMHPSSMNLYGVDFKAQYIEFTFITEKALNRVYAEGLHVTL